MEKRIIVVDIDGTLSVVGQRRRFIEQEPKDWERFYMDDFNDLPIRDICDFVRHMAKTCEIIFCTSRSECVRQKTQLWLQRNLLLSPRDYTLIMRPAGDTRPDFVSKLVAFTNETTPDERARVAFVLEDSACMAAMWRHHGFRCFHVADGN